MRRLGLLAIVFSVGCGGGGAHGVAPAQAAPADSNATVPVAAGTDSVADASPSASAASSASVLAPESQRPCPPGTPRQPISFSATPWRLPGNTVDRPVLFSAEKDGEPLIAPIVGAIDRAVKDCGANCHARCEVAKNDGQLFSVHCSVVRPSGAVKFFGRADSRQLLADRARKRLVRDASGRERGSRESHRMGWRCLRPSGNR